MLGRLRANPDTESLTLVAKQLWIAMTKPQPEIDPVKLTAQECLELVFTFHNVTGNKSIGLGLDLK